MAFIAQCFEVRMTTAKGDLIFTPKTASELHFGRYDPAMRTNMYKEVIDVLK
jgi:hypothetical protein